ncbi:ATP-dependent helicase C-terminal domain-containing protein [Trueperella bernardiae]|uniref:ATP-dependent helicase C-terminal domain-containing protein n=1 Tax=Trueperella bernardiae TaxID=59561 RepID=A0AAW6ZMS1_9ACTO|nr:ATP-dependent helicase C-terminal domain-containing protein [Trueperella bernardiae]MDK8601808.1 ATP-dependent helicase C-terminal domain-containing protein [Trueperella bernardiae]
MERLLENLPDLPVARGLGDIARQRGNIVMTAPPGSGKTMLVPVLMATLVEGRVIVVQPRRVAARAAARRIAYLLGEPVGQQVGFRVRGESKPGSRVEMVTPGVMLRMLQHDPELAGVGAVIIDEIHERDLDTDLATAFVLDVQDTLRPDLRLVAMSATLEAGRFAELVGGAVVEIPGAIHPVAVEERLGPRALTDVGHGVVVSRDFLAHVARVVHEAAQWAAGRGGGSGAGAAGGVGAAGVGGVVRGEGDPPGSVLVFLPGVGEIEKMRALLAGAPLPVMALHGSMPAKEQDRVLAGGEDRIILATSLAESSLTVPGVRAVVDAALAREPRFEPRTGISDLVTVHASRARLDQRAGRAGREGPGRAWRCLSYARAVEFSEPEIVVGDVTGASLQAAAWGNPGMAGLRLLDQPKPAAAEAAQRTLAAIGAVEESGVITARGRALAGLPLSPQLGRALIEGAAVVGARRAAEVVALLSLAPRIPGADLAAQLRRSGGDREWAREAKRLKELAGRLGAVAGGRAGQVTGEVPGQAGGRARAGAGALVQAGTGARRASVDEEIAAVVVMAHPMWVARRRGRGYVLANGAGAVLEDGSPLEGQEWLAVAELGEAQGRADAVIRAAVPVAPEDAAEYGPGVSERVETAVRGMEVTGARVRALGAIELGREPVKLTTDQVAAARAREVERAGVGMLDWPAAAVALRERLAFLHEAVGEPWPDVSDEGLAACVDEWLTPLLGAGRPDLLAGLRALLPWPEAARLDELAPERIATPTGSAKVDYSSGVPTVRLRLQECFGWTATPRLAGVPVTLELLSPAQRPLAITRDLESFWAGSYAQVRAEMRGRYPRHPWPEDPLTAEPTRRAKPRAGR